jgi:hypothetical protein
VLSSMVTNLAIAAACRAADAVLSAVINDSICGRADFSTTELSSSQQPPLRQTGNMTDDIATGRRITSGRNTGGRSVGCDQGPVINQSPAVVSAVPERRGRRLCPHNRRQHRCKDCGGSSICEHGRRKSQCKDCGGSGICAHGRQKSQCKFCGGIGICQHGRRKSQCRDCGGSAFCEHGREKRRCKDCVGSGICALGRQKCQCKDAHDREVSCNNKTDRFATKEEAEEPPAKRLRHADAADSIQK